MKLSLVCPTRNRPLFVEKLVTFASLVTNDDIEFIVVDNSTPGNMETWKAFHRDPHGNIKYVRSPDDLSMVENWNFGLDQTDADYIGFLTDKMFPLADPLERVIHFLEKEGPDMLTWFDNLYSPDSFEDYFGMGSYTTSLSIQLDSFEEFDAKADLSRRILGRTSRSDMRREEYTRGKICFGVYSQRLINQIKNKYEKIFFPLSPDYTSLVLALGSTSNAYSTNFPVIVHVNTDISNGNNIAINDKHALDFLSQSGVDFGGLDHLPIPNLYSSLNNIVLFDFLQMCKLMNRPISEDLSVWHRRIYEDVMNSKRHWSSADVMHKQQSLVLGNVLTNGFEIANHLEVNIPLTSKLKESVFQSLPNSLQNIIKKHRPRSFGFRCSQIEDILSI